MMLLSLLIPELTHPTLLNSLFVEGVHGSPEGAERPLCPLQGPRLGQRLWQTLWGGGQWPGRRDRDAE